MAGIETTHVEGFEDARNTVKSCLIRKDNTMALQRETTLMANECKATAQT